MFFLKLTLWQLEKRLFQDFLKIFFQLLGQYANVSKISYKRCAKVGKNEQFFSKHAKSWFLKF